MVCTEALAARQEGLRSTRLHQAENGRELGNEACLFSLQLDSSVRRWRVQIAICRGCDQPGVLPFCSFSHSLRVRACMHVWVCLPGWMDRLKEGSRGHEASNGLHLSWYSYPKHVGLEHVCTSLLGVFFTTVHVETASQLNAWHHEKDLLHTKAQL